MSLSDDATKNRLAWDRYAAAYQRKHAGQLDQAPLAWGTWSIPEAELQILGPVAGRDILELGCGAAQWGIALAQQGARVVGIDNSAAQLGFARDAAARAGVDITLIHTSAERVPLPDDRFDIIFCDHGAMSFLDPRLALPEVSRLLRSGGRFAFNLASALFQMCFDEDADAVSQTLQVSAFDLGRIEDDGFVEHALTHGAWIRLLRTHDLIVEDLVELRAPEGRETTYDFAPYDWARRWPAEEIWVTRRR
ncbi:MAG: class I SAM-dependent methyltransferase [Myxococcota bacterium]